MRSQGREGAAEVGNAGDFAGVVVENGDEMQDVAGTAPVDEQIGSEDENTSPLQNLGTPLLPVVLYVVVVVAVAVVAVVAVAAAVAAAVA
eukprot:CAMPEP_0175105020 /NCGR_PEP_ID=MMETSP0086_2-20121207/10138_1 /TAXON_ID=136419 /ORGANISM="Unknown Unknown, Strain D1" /LENGTH=89 /DNA_ID=CAMNT_0016380651 /DNA_START=320 /DNA_END=585 /DNA_ORIENTATION=+